MTNICLIGGGSRFEYFYKNLPKNISVIAIFPKDKKTKSFLNINNYRGTILNELNELPKLITQKKIEFILCLGYGKYIKSDIFLLGSAKWINTHASLLPKYRGGSPINWSIINGEDFFGCSIIEMSKGLDKGPIILQKKIKLKDLNYLEAVEKSNILFSSLLNKFFSKPNYYWKKRKLQRGESSHYCTRIEKDSRIYFKQMSDESIFNHFRALMNPISPPFFYYKKKKCFINQCSLIKQNIFGPPGRIAGRIDGQFVIICNNRGLAINKIQINQNIIESKNFFITGDDID